jgi:small multidrug resistance pump
MKNWLFLSIAILSEVIATSTLKYTDSFTKLWPSVLVFVGYCISFYFLSLSLRTIPVGISYAIWSGFGTVLITLAAWALYDQNLDIPAFLGIGLIVGGVVVMNIFSKAVPH